MKSPAGPGPDLIGAWPQPASSQSCPPGPTGDDPRPPEEEEKVMTSLPADPPGVIVGVDTHQDVHVAVALDALGRRLGELQIAATTSGYGQLVRWVRELDPAARFGVDRVALAAPMPGRAIRPVHLHDSQAVAAQIAVQPGAVAAGALDAEPPGRTQLAHPADQLAVAAGRGRDLQLTEAAAQCIERDRNMHILMGVDTDDDTRWIGGQTGHDLLLLLRRTWVITGRAGRTGL